MPPAGRAPVAAMHTARGTAHKAASAATRAGRVERSRSAIGAIPSLVARRRGALLPAVSLDLVMQCNAVNVEHLRRACLVPARLFQHVEDVLLLDVLQLFRSA